MSIYQRLQKLGIFEKLSIQCQSLLPPPFRDQTKAAPWPAAIVTFCTSIALSNCSSNPSCTAFEIASLMVSALCATLRSMRARADPRPAEAVGLESA